MLVQQYSDIYKTKNLYYKNTFFNELIYLYYIYIICV